MERIQVLIEKLQQQYQQKENASSMLVTLQLLQNELTALQNTNKILGTSKVSVVMPYSSRPGANIGEEQRVQAPAPASPSPFETKPEANQVMKTEASEKKEYEVSKPMIQEASQAPSRPNVPLYNHYEDAVLEAPTLLQQQIHKEVHELISNPKEELNDRLKQNQKELAHVLKESPVKDLRKAIGVNDKFVFISELFRGDEQMYERSIKTINTFHILPEAEYWMNRELKVKLGWNDNKDIVQHFYQLVRRRFS
jgi:hypothetical protein